jgi:hypothetical protein
VLRQLLSEQVAARCRWQHDMCARVAAGYVLAPRQEPAATPAASQPNPTVPSTQPAPVAPMKGPRSSLRGYLRGSSLMYRPLPTYTSVTPASLVLLLLLLLGPAVLVAGGASVVVVTCTAGVRGGVSFQGRFSSSHMDAVQPTRRVASGVCGGGGGGGWWWGRQCPPHRPQLTGQMLHIQRREAPARTVAAGATAGPAPGWKGQRGWHHAPRRFSTL